MDADQANSFICPSCNCCWSTVRQLKVHYPSCLKKNQLDSAKKVSSLDDGDESTSYFINTNHSMKSDYNENDSSDDDNESCCNYTNCYSDEDDDDADNISHGSDDASSASDDADDESNNGDTHLDGFNHSVQTIGNDDEADTLSRLTCDMDAHQPSALTKLQVNLNNMLNRHKCSLQLYDDVVDMVNEYIGSPEFSTHGRLMHRKKFMKKVECTYGTQKLKPTNMETELHNNVKAIVPVFDVKHMIIDLLTNKNLMSGDNIVSGYDIFTGKIAADHPSQALYGEIPTGDAWQSARDHYCGNSTMMPVGLVIFGDKSHTDLHGALSLTPIIFTLTLFNRTARNNASFWRPIAYLPNLGYGKSQSDKTLTANKVQDEHNCLSTAFASLRKLHREGGIEAEVCGRKVLIKVWIQFFIGDIEGNNKWLAHMPGNREGVSRPYRDCHCGFNDLSNTNPRCKYATLQEMEDAKKLMLADKEKGTAMLKNMSRYDVENALLHADLPLSDQIHGPYQIMPPELLHTSGSGLIQYMFGSLRTQIGGGENRDIIDQQHVRMSMYIHRQSDRDFPRGSMRNGLIDGTKCQASERRGNLFRLLCVARTTDGRRVFMQSLGIYNAKEWDKFVKFLQDYLGMEEWMHDSNPKGEVKSARGAIAKVLSELQSLFPREGNSNGYNIPKMHGMTKFQEYIQLFGSGMNFFGGPGEAHHKVFVKAPGQKTQRRVSEFAAQTANQYYNVMVTNQALISMERKRAEVVGTTDGGGDRLSVEFRGRYEFCVTNKKLKEMEDTLEVIVQLKARESRNDKEPAMLTLHKDLVRMIIEAVKDRGSIPDEGIKVAGYTILAMNDAETRTIYYAHPCFKGQEWYDWAYIQYWEWDRNDDAVERYYPSKLLGFLSIGNETVKVAIRTSTTSVPWSKVQKEFFSGIRLGSEFKTYYQYAPITSIVHPLCVIPDYGGDEDAYMVVLPKRNWSRYFGDRIVVKKKRGRNETM